MHPLTQEKLTQTSLAALLAGIRCSNRCCWSRASSSTHCREVTLAAKLAQWSSLRNQSAAGFLDQLLARINELGTLLASTASLEQLEIVAGRDKSGHPEQVERIRLQRGDL